MKIMLWVYPITTEEDRLIQLFPLSDVVLDVSIKLVRSFL